VDGFLVLRALTDRQIALREKRKEKEYGGGGGPCAERVNEEGKDGKPGLVSKGDQEQAKEKEGYGIK
jgi:hypothetical protein